MANLNEIALGLASVLRSDVGPEPLPVTLWGQSVADSLFLLKTIIRECHDANIHLHKVEADPELVQCLDEDSSQQTASYLGVKICSSADLHKELRIFRRA